MAQTAFYAARRDEVDVLRFVFDETDCDVYEAHSRYDEDLRRFDSLDAVREALAVGRDRPRETRTVLLDLWSPATGARPLIARVDLDVPGAQFRYELRGWGLFRLELGGSGEGTVGESWFAHNTARRARRMSEAYEDLSPPDEWDWEAVTRIGRRIVRHIRTRLAVAKVGSAPVLRGAEELRREGWALGA